MDCITPIRFGVGGADKGATECRGFISDVSDVWSGSRVTRNGAELLRNGRELTTKVGNNLGLSLCAVPRLTVVRVVAYFKRTELLSEISERSGID